MTTAEMTKEIEGKIVDMDPVITVAPLTKDTKENKSKWFKTKIQNNTIKYTLNGSSTKVEKHYFPLDGAENNRFPNSGQLATHMNFCIQKSTRKEVFGYDKDLRLGVKTITTREKNPASCELPPGCYQYHINSQTGEEGLVPFTIRNDAYVDTDGALEATKRSIKMFIDRKSIYIENNLIYKLGVMMYGPPGQGKTSLIRHLVSNCFPKDTVTIFLNSLPSNFLMKASEALGKNTLKVLIFEEFTEIEEKLKRSGGTDTLLQFLDGEFSLDHSIILATTNYPEKVPENIVNRPGRFDKLMNFDLPSPTAIRKFLKFFLGREVEDTEVQIVKGLSIAAIKEVCLMHRVEDIPFIDSAKALLARKEICKNKFKSNNPGFKL